MSAAAAQKNRLGRGLASLIGDLETAQDTAGVETGHQTVSIDAIRPSPYNPRQTFPETELEELAGSIREKGLVQPIILRPVEGAEAAYEIVAGERRWRAAQRAALHEVPAIVRTLSDQEALELAIIENVQRSDLNAIEEALGYRQLITSFKYKQEELATVLGKSRSHLANMLRLLKLPEAVQEFVRSGRLSAGHARALVGRSDAEAVAREIVERGLNVRDVEALVQERDDGKAKAKKKAPLKDADTRAAESELSDALGLAVSLKSGKGESGELRIRYSSFEQLEDVRHRLLRAGKH